MINNNNINLEIEIMKPKSLERDQNAKFIWVQVFIKILGLGLFHWF